MKGQPNKMTVNQAQTLMYVAEDQSDSVDVINLQANSVVESIPVIAPHLYCRTSLLRNIQVPTPTV